MHRESKMFMMFAGVLLLVFVLFATWGIIHLEQRINQCSAANGIVVKTPDGWKCVEAKTLL